PSRLCQCQGRGFANAAAGTSHPDDSIQQGLHPPTPPAIDRQSYRVSARSTRAMMIVFSSTMIFSTGSRTVFARSPDEPLALVEHDPVSRSTYFTARAAVPSTPWIA